MIIRPKIFEKTIKFGCLILEEIKERLLNYRIIGKDLMRLLES